MVQGGNLPHWADAIDDPAQVKRRQKLATTGSAPSVFSTLGGP
jgi:hypothetical protein